MYAAFPFSTPVLTPLFPPADVDPTTRHSHFGSRLGGDKSQDTSQSADPDLGHYDPARGRSDDQTHPSSGGQDHGQQGQWRQGGQTAGDNTYGGGGDPRQTGYRTGQVVGGPQERFETSQNYGTSTGTGPGARPDDYDIHGDGGLGGKPAMPERAMGESVLSLLLVGDVIYPSVLSSGTAEKVVGKATGNVRMYEQGQERKVCRPWCFNFAYLRDFP